MSIRGKAIARIVIEQNPQSGSVHVIAYSVDGDRLADRIVFTSYWQDRFRVLVESVERETR